MTMSPAMTAPVADNTIIRLSRCVDAAYLDKVHTDVDVTFTKKCESGRPPVVRGSAKRRRADDALTDAGIDAGREKADRSSSVPFSTLSAAGVEPGAPTEIGASAAFGESSSDRTINEGTTTGRDGRDGGTAGAVTIVRDTGDGALEPAALKAATRKV